METLRLDTSQLKIYLRTKFSDCTGNVSLRGAAIAAAAMRDIPVFEYAPRIKQAVVGNGRASKEQVARTVRALLANHELLDYDEADATAAALCHAMTWRDQGEI